VLAGAFVDEVFPLCQFDADIVDEYDRILGGIARCAHQGDLLECNALRGVDFAVVYCLEWRDQLIADDIALLNGIDADGNRPLGPGGVAPGKAWRV
jgi:hypothetical protein